MRGFYQHLLGQGFASRLDAASEYLAYMRDERERVLLTARQDSRSRFYVGLGSLDSDLSYITRRGVLVCDILLLTHCGMDGFFTTSNPQAWRLSPDKQLAGVHGVNLAALADWLIDARPLLEAGLAWYLPRYATQTAGTFTNSQKRLQRDPGLQPVDFLVRDGRAIQISGDQPIASNLVRPILHADLPFIDGVSMRDFGEITVSEFDSYSAFRDYLRQRLLSLDDGLNAIQSERELTRIGLEIRDGIRSVQAQMRQARRRRAVGAAGAVVGTVGAVLAAVYGKTLAEVVPIAGASGGVWQIIQAAAENNPRAVRDDKWYYVWVLAEKAET